MLLALINILLYNTRLILSDRLILHLSIHAYDNVAVQADLYLTARQKGLLGKGLLAAAVGMGKTVSVHLHLVKVGNIRHLACFFAYRGMMTAICGNCFEYGAKLKRAVIFSIMIRLTDTVVIIVIVEFEYKSVGGVGKGVSLHLGSTHDVLDVLLQLGIRFSQD